MKTAAATDVQKQNLRTPYVKLSFWGKVWRDVTTNPVLYLMFLPVVLYYVLFCYKPMYGALIAFMDYVPGVEFWENDWIGFENFVRFFQDRNFWRLL